MKIRIKKTIHTFVITLPIMFVLLFIGYLRPTFDVTLYTDNIVGEGLGSVQLCRDESFSYNYEAYFYFGSQLKHVEMKGFHYDVDQLSLGFSDVEEADFLYFDVVAYGFPLGHYEFNNVPTGEYGNALFSPAESGNGAHIVFKEPKERTGFSFYCDFLPFWFWLIYWSVFILIALIVSLIVSYIIDRFPRIVFPVLKVSAIAATLVVGCWFCGSLSYVEYTKFLLNLLILIGLSLLIDSLTLPFLGTAFIIVFTTFWYTANYYIIMFRHKPIMPADLKAIGTAREVVGGYTLTPSIQMVTGIVIVLVYISAVIFIWSQNRNQDMNRKPQLLRRGINIAVSVTLLFAAVHSPIYTSLNSFQWDAKILNNFHKDGMVLTFLKSLESSRVTKPEGYSRAIVDKYLAEYDGEVSTELSGNTQPTNIIMVMNEAFSDLRAVGMDQAIDVMPYIDSLDQNVIEGSLFVSVYGGGTCNTEFEALTGNSLAFLNSGAYPYTENVTKPMFSLASYLRDKGYMTNAFHANEADNWNRDRVYPNLGFERFYSINDYIEHGEIETLHAYPADKTDYAFMEDVSAENTGKPMFLFNVTMQNHASYERWEDVKEADCLKETEIGFDGKVYLSLIKASDDAVKQLVEYYRDSEEPTMIIFFGDHQPSLERSTQGQIYTDSWRLNWYQSKFFIWTNYKTETEHDAKISANYLPWLIMERAGFEMPPYIQMLGELHAKYPVITSQGIVDIDGNFYTDVGELLGDPLILKYQYVQYANIFDEIDDGWFELR